MGLLHLLIDAVRHSSVLYSGRPKVFLGKQMNEPVNPRRPRRGSYRLKPETVALLKTSGNTINGVGETTPRRPSPFFRHPPDQHPWGELQILARQNSRKCPGSAEAFQAAYYYPELILVADVRNGAPAENAASCGICIAECPWTRPMVRPKLLTTMARGLGQ